jgi:uncharacterized protein YmfQ (DUF2313 family)
MTCANGLPAPDICPTQDEIVPQLLALLPRGRAFGTHAGLPPAGSTIHDFWNAVANVWFWINTRICALKLEFFCATANETLDLWLQEYGLPDGCDPFPGLCAKVAGFGGVTCDYYVALAAAIGWSLSCGADCAADAGAIEAGMAVGPSWPPGVFPVVIDLAASPAAGAPPGLNAGCIEAGMTPSCIAPSAVYAAGCIEAGMPPDCLAVCQPEAGCASAGEAWLACFDVAGLDCLLARAAPAHAMIRYVFV